MQLKLGSRPNQQGFVIKTRGLKQNWGKQTMWIILGWLIG